MDEDNHRCGWRREAELLRAEVEDLRRKLASIEPRPPTVANNLHEMLELHESASRWDSMVDTLEKMAELEPHPQRKSRHLLATAQLCFDKLEDHARAIKLCNDALDIDPGYLEAFERIQQILVQREDWTELARAHRKMLHRLASEQAPAGKADLEFHHWHALGVLYRDRLADHGKAIEALEIAQRLRPNDASTGAILAGIFAAGGDADSALAAHRASLAVDPTNADSYRKMFGIYLTRKDHDRAWCLAAVLTFLHEADDEAQRFFNDHRPRGLQQPRSRLGQDDWTKRLFHEDESLRIGKIFALITPAALRAKTEILKANNALPKLEERFRQDPAMSTVTFARLFGWAASSLGLPTPPLFVRLDIPSHLVHAPADEVCSLAGEAALIGHSPSELCFILGQHLSYYRGEHLIKTLFPTVTELTVFFLAAVKLVAPGSPTPKPMEEHVQATTRQLGRFMQTRNTESLRVEVERFIAEGAVVNLKRWSQAVDITAARAGFLLSGDLETARKLLAREARGPGALSASEQMKALTVFAASESYFDLRRQLGLDIPGRPGG